MTEPNNSGAATIDRRFSVEPTRTDWIIGGHRYDLLSWDRERWGQLPDDEKPENARPIDGGGWAILRSTDTN